jgi:hypothetical protein
MASGMCMQSQVIKLLCFRIRFKWTGRIREGIYSHLSHTIHVEVTLSSGYTVVLQNAT